MYNILTLVQILLPIAFLVYTWFIYYIGETNMAKVLNASACNELFIAIIVFVALQLIVSYLIKKSK